MVQKVGVLVPNLFDSQLAYMTLTELNNLSSLYNYDVSVFFEELTPYLMKPQFGVYNASEIFHFDGNLIATTLDTAKSMLSTLKPVKKIFYVWSLEYLEKNSNFIENIGVFQSTYLELIAPSEDYAKDIRNYCGIYPRVVENFSIKEIL